ncbi:MAG: Holliday junction resolvase RuvX [Candidatus Kapaibacteriales bacterium]
MKRVLAIDYGKKRIGLAITDPLRIICRPFDTIENSTNTLENIVQICLEQDVGLIVLGIPISNRESNTSIIDDINEFKIDLEIKTGIKIILQDESYSSKRASSMMIQSGMKKKDRQQKGKIDAFAACSILQDYLQENQ